METPATQEELNTATEKLRTENLYLRTTIDMFNLISKLELRIDKLCMYVSRLEKRLDEISPDELKPLENEQFSIDVVSSNYRE